MTSLLGSFGEVCQKVAMQWQESVELKAAIKNCPKSVSKISQIRLASAIKDDNSPKFLKRIFNSSDTIWAVAYAEVKERMIAVQANWTHVDSDQMINSTLVIAYELGARPLPFFISKPDGWPTGDYRVDILINGSVMKTATFQVQ